MNEPGSQFVAVVSLLVQHEYFAGGLCRELSFEPDEESASLMRQHRLLLKATDSGFTLVAELMPGLSYMDGMTLRFNVFAGDPLFASFTREAQELGIPLYFASASANANGQLQAARLPETLVLAPPTVNRLRRPAFVVDIVLRPQDFHGSSRSVYVPTRSFTIQLHARALHWKYLFFGDLARYDLYIEDSDPENPVSFSACDEALVKSGKALISHMPLPMGQDPLQRLQLKDGNKAGRILIRRLPNASMKKIGKISGPDGSSIYVAEIYINQ